MSVAEPVGRRIQQAAHLPSMFGPVSSPHSTSPCAPHPNRHLVAIQWTRTAGELTTFFDGTMVDKASASSSALASPGCLVLGQEIDGDCSLSTGPGGLSRPFVGSLGTVNLFGTILSASSLACLATSCLASACAGVVPLGSWGTLGLVGDTLVDTQGTNSLVVSRTTPTVVGACPSATPSPSPSPHPGPACTPACFLSMNDSAIGGACEECARVGPLACCGGSGPGCRRRGEVE